MLRKKSTEKLARLKRYLFLRPKMYNHEVGIDVSSTSDAVCMGVTYVQVRIERKSECSSPSFHTRLQAYVYDWSRQTGWSRLVRYEQEAHDGGVSSSILIKNGVMIKPAGMETPEQISRIGRRGDMYKKTTSKATEDTHVSGTESKDMILGECLSNY